MSQEARLPNAMSILVDCELTLNATEMVSDHPPFYITSDPHRRKHIIFLILCLLARVSNELRRYSRGDIVSAVILRSEVGRLSLF